jgi:hypothetical protein
MRTMVTGEVSDFPKVERLWLLGDSPPGLDFASERESE